MDYYQIEFEPVGRRGACRADESLLEAARQLGVDLINLCGWDLRALQGSGPGGLRIRTLLG